MERQLRFELEVSGENALNLAIYDQKDPVNTLWLTTLTKESFEVIKAQQNLVIEQFSLLPAHLIHLFDHCLYNRELKAQSDSSCQLSGYGSQQPQQNSLKFVCAIRSHTDEGVEHINCTVYQWSSLTHLRHISLNLMAATDF